MIAPKLRFLAVAFCLSAALSPAVFAQSAAPAAPVETPPAVTAKSGNPMAACRADMKALCNGVPANGGAKMNCLVENKAKASAECQAAMAVIQERAGARKDKKIAKAGQREACASDLATLCSSATTGKERSQCLRQNEGKLSPACGNAINETRDVRKAGNLAAIEACSADSQTLCAEGGKGRGAVMQCLRQNEAKVSPACQQALAALPGRKGNKGAGNPAAADPAPAPAASAPAAVPKPQ